MKIKLLVWIMALILLVTAVQGAWTDNLIRYYAVNDASSPLIESIQGKNAVENGTGLSYQQPANTTNLVYSVKNSGTSGHFEAPALSTDYIKNATALTIVFVGKTPTTTTTENFMKLDSDGVGGMFFKIDMRTNNSLMFQDVGTGYFSNQVINDDTWFMGTYIANATGIYLIINNGTIERVKASAWSRDGAGNNFPLSILPREGSNRFIDNIMIFNTSKSLSDIHTIWNNGDILVYSASSSTTDVSFTIKDQWNGSSIQTFNVDVSWSNGTTTEHTTTNGTVSLINITSGAINVTYWNMTDYFNRTTSATLTANISNSVTTNTYQAVLCLNASEKISGGWVTANNFTIGNNVTSSCFNITAGTHNVKAQKTGWFSQNQTFSISALSNTTQTVQNLSYANLTIYAKDGVTNASLSGYNLTIKSLNYTGWVGESASSVTNYSFKLINGTYNVTIAMPGYSVTEAQANITVSGNTNYTFYIYLANSVSITIRDEITNAPIIGPNITVRWSDNTTTWENTTNTSTLFVSNITATNYTLLFYSSNYSTRTYTITVGPSSHQFLTAYMISSTYSTIFTIKDIDTGILLEDVSITMYKLINSTWTTVESKVSDISGKAQFYYDPIANYRFYLSATDYEDYVFYLNPILFSTYDVYMTKTSVLDYSVDFDDISFIYSPTIFNNNQNQTMNFLISSPGGMLTNYGITVIYPGGNDTDSGVNAIGEQLTVDVNVTNATAFDYVVLEFNYTTSLAGTRSYTFNLPINMNITSGTWLSSKDKTYGMGIFERMLIATIIIIFVVGIATMVGQALPGIALGLFVYGFLVFIGFVPLWAILPSMLVGVLFLIWKSGGY